MSDEATLRSQLAPNNIIRSNFSNQGSIEEFRHTGDLEFLMHQPTADTNHQHLIQERQRRVQPSASTEAFVSN